MSQLAPMLPLLGAAVLAGVGFYALFHGFFLGAPDWSDVVTHRLRFVDGLAGAAAGPAEDWSNPREVFRSMTDALDKPLKRHARGKKLSDRLQQADLKLKSVEWLGVTIGVSSLCALALYLRFGSVIAVPVGLAVGWFGCGYFLSFRVRRRRRKFANQLGDTIVLLSNALKAGYSFGQAIQTVSESCSAPIASEFARTAREISYGVAVEEALQHLAARNQSDDLDLVCTAVQIHRIVGGNLADILDAIAFTIRERVRIKGAIKTLTAQARASGWIIICLPPALAGILSVISPSYFGPMLHSGVGNAMLGLCAFLELTGYLVMRKIVAIKV